MLEKESSPIYKNKTKKERHMLNREKLKLSDLHRGIKDMKHLPNALFVIDANHEKIAIAEAKCLGIPTFGLVDTNTNPFSLDYPIPANDDSIKTISLIMSYISDSILDAVGGSKNKEVTEEVVKNEEPIIESMTSKGNDDIKKDNNIDK
jgi:small subunit ribosomal protein S2